MRCRRGDSFLQEGSETRTLRRTLRAAGAPAGVLETLEARQLLSSVFAVTDNNQLIEFDSANPQTILRALPITGLGAGEVMSAIDFHAGSEKLYGIPSGNRTPVYTINRTTGVATRIGPGVPFNFPLDRATGLDFDELNGYFRYIDETFGNYRIDAVTGLQLRNDAGQEGLSNIAYRPLNGDPANFGFFGVNHITNQFMRLDPERMTVLSTGPLGIDIDRFVGLDVSPAGVIALSVRVDGVNRFGTIGDDGHSFVEIGTIGNGTQYSVRSIAVEPARKAPVLSTAIPPALGSISEDHLTSTGTLVRDLLKVGEISLVTDPNPGAEQGIALTGVDSSIGVWQYTLNGLTWSPVGAPSESLALLLPSNGTARIRLIPAANFNGHVAEALRFRAWDQMVGQPGQRISTGPGGGDSSFSAASVWASIQVLAVRDAPTVTLPQPSGGSFQIDDNQTVTPFASATIGYVDSASHLLTVDVQLLDPSHGGFTQASLSASGFVLVDADSATYRFVGTAAAATAALRQLIFAPTENLVPVGEQVATLLRVVVADGLGGPAQAFSPFIAVRSVRNEPVVTVGGGPLVINDKQTTIPFFQTTIGDIEVGPRTLTVDVVVDPATGSLTEQSVLDSGFMAVAESPGTFRYVGPAEAATLALRQLVFVPHQSLGAAGTSRVLTLQLIVNDGVAPVQIASPNIAVLSQNDRPTIAGLTVNNVLRKRPNMTVRPFRTTVIADPDPAARVTVTVRINQPRKGLITANSLRAAGFKNLGNGRYQFTGNTTAATNRIRKLRFTWASTLNTNIDHKMIFRLTVADELGAQIMNNKTLVTLRR